MASVAPGALVTLSVDPNLPLERRIELLSYAFAKAVNSDVLQRVVDWDIVHGKVKFVLTPKGFRSMPRGHGQQEDFGEGVVVDLQAI